MTQYTRRDALVATGSVSTLAVAGCLNDGGADEPNGANGTQAGGTNANSHVESVETFQLGGSLSRPEWAQADDRTGLVSVAESPQDIAWLVADPERVDGLEAWLSETDFDDAVVLCAQTVGPNTCVDELAVSDVAVTDDVLENESEPQTAITASIHAVDTSEEREACGETITYPAALVRITGDDLPSVATVSITDGWGETSEVDTTSGLLDASKLPGFVQPPHDPQPASVLE
ncbi:hypothetical protein [Natrialba chahannaoensis]|uniref:hypothetical protein n=1 Tax=Natrialba chahannaoensis TaxID=68911 RepID=UPI0006780EF4|nr:hypothetical protein [Natrialba chahannaoensis]